MADAARHLDARTLSRLHALELRARGVVEGTLTGMHQSPYRGVSIEFAEHREYVPGDEIRHLDWKVLGRTDRLYVKQYEEETNVRAMLCVDMSKSMDYRSNPETLTKGDYAATAAAALAHLLLAQRDAVGLTCFDRAVARQVPYSTNPSHMRVLLEALASSETRPATDIGRTLHELAETLPRRGLVVLCSDLFDTMASTLAGLRHLRHRDHEVVLFHVLDRAEIEFPFEALTLFEGLEASLPLLADPRALRTAYLEELGRFRTEVKQGCSANQVDYVEMITDQPLEVALTGFLATRASRRGARHR